VHDPNEVGLPVKIFAPGNAPRYFFTVYRREERGFSGRRNAPS
jgi:hypothetical protein